jgi:hypothetical protein
MNANSVTTVTGATGKSRRVRDAPRGIGTTDFKAASGITEGEYWIEQ